MKTTKFTKTHMSALLAAALTLGLMPTLAACGGGKDQAQPEAGTKASPSDASAAKAGAKAVDPAVQTEANEALSADSGLNPKVMKAVSIAREIDADPSKSDDVLAKYKLSRDDLSALMYEIARDPKLAASYAAAREKS
jgi:hypothetical protein